MTEQRHYCDRCHCIILEARSLMRIETGPVRLRHQNIDLCHECAGLFLGWLEERQITNQLAEVAGGQGR